MISGILQLIALADIQIGLLEKNKIKEIRFWQTKEKVVLDRLANINLHKKEDVPEVVFRVLSEKAKKKHYLVKRRLSVTKKLLSVLSTDDDFYSIPGKTRGGKFISIVDKKV